MKIEIIADEIFANGEKVATTITDPRKSTIIEDFRDEMARRDRRWH